MQKQDSLVLPKILRLTAKNKSLLYFGTYHSNNPKDSLFERLHHEFQNFKPDFVVYEGSNWPIYATADSTISFSGEPGYMISLCQNYNIQSESIEPKESDEYKAVLKNYGIDWVVLMYLCRQISQQQRLLKTNNTTDQEFEKNISYLLSSMRANGVPIDNKQLRYGYWRNKYMELLKKDLDWRTFDPIEYYPNYNVTKMNEVSRASDNFRNQFMVHMIAEKLKTHNKVMAVVGAGHLFAQEKELHLLFDQNFKVK